MVRVRQIETASMTAAYVLTSWLVWMEMALCGVLAIPKGRAVKVGVVSWVSKQPWSTSLSVSTPCHAVVCGRACAAAALQPTPLVRHSLLFCSSAL